MRGGTLSSTGCIRSAVDGSADRRPHGRLARRAVTFETGRPGVFATGDVRIGAATVVQAIAARARELKAQGRSADEVAATVQMEQQAAHPMWARANSSARALRCRIEDIFATAIELGWRNGEFHAPQGAVSSRGLESLLRRFTLPVRQIQRFDELPIPFRAVATDMETGEAMILKDGDLATAMRSSMSVPGVFAPVEVDGRILGDGGLVNNLPVDVMREHAMGAGPIIACDVTGELDLQARDDRYGERPWWWLLGQRMRGSPSIISILMRSGTVGSEAQRRGVREQADYLFEPPLDGIGMRDWKSFEQAIARGYAHAMLEIEKHGVPLSDRWASGPAVSIVRPGEA